MKTELLAVYGTLRKGCHNHHYLHNSPLIAEGFVPGMMYDLGSFPGAVKDPSGDNWMFAEVYEATPKTVECCDRLEGHPNWYQRQQVSMLANNKEQSGLKVWVYYYTYPIPPACQRVESGDWKNQSEEVQ